MKVIGRLVRNRNSILLLAIVLGLSVGRPLAGWTEPSVLPLLAVVMTLSALNVTSRELITIKEMPWPVGLSLLLNYLVMGGVILLLAWWLIDDIHLRTGFVVFAAVPPAAGVVSFSYSLGGNLVFSLIGMTAAYLAALFITPGIMALFLGTGYLNTLNLLTILGELILIPIVLSRILIATRLAARIKPWQGTITNWSFFVVIYTIIGLNRQAFFREFDILALIIVIAVVTSFILGLALYNIATFLRVSRETSISMILMGTTKNYGLASGILLTLFGERAALPASVCAVFGILHIVWLGFRFRKDS